MKNVFKFLAITALIAVIGLSYTACGDGSGDNGGSGSGGGGSGNSGLKGTSWAAKDTDSGSIASHDYTITITFTSDDMLTIKRVGWFEIRKQHVNGYNITYTTERTNVNDTFNGTYTYFPNIKEGYMNSDYWNINPWNFKILSDNKTMAGKLDTNQFTKK